jgi:hypothetical protein
MDSNQLAHTVACGLPEENHRQRKQKGHWSEEGHSDADGEGGDSFVV